MKKTILTFFISILFASWSVAGTENYSLQNAQVDAIFANSEDITLSLSNELGINSISNSAEMVESGKSVGGFLLRSFFCGSIALHRYYMGTSGESMWWKYLCIPIAGGLANCGDFFGVLFKGQDQLNKYSNNGEFFVWM